MWFFLLSNFACYCLKKFAEKSADLVFNEENYYRKLQKQINWIWNLRSSDLCVYVISRVCGYINAGIKCCSIWKMSVSIILHSGECYCAWSQLIYACRLHTYVRYTLNIRNHLRKNYPITHLRLSSAPQTRDGHFIKKNIDTFIRFRILFDGTNTIKRKYIMSINELNRCGN